MSKYELRMPLVSNIPEAHDPPWKSLWLRELIEKLVEEEDYWLREENNTIVQITRLRKIFYDKGGWDEQVIRQAANIESRYETILVDGDGDESNVAETKNTPGKHRGKQFTNEMRVSLRRRELRTVSSQNLPHAGGLYRPQYRKVVYRKTDRVYPDRAGQEADIYKDNHQEVRVPDKALDIENYISDIGHILTGCDAYNYPDTVGLLPGRLNILRLGPHVTSNVDFATWLGDIASTSAAFLFTYFQNKKAPTIPEMQEIINEFVPASDMMGNIDAFVIASHYDITLRKGIRFTDILKDYYLTTPSHTPLRNFRYQLFCEAVGLRDWDGTGFSNEASWLKYYHTELLAGTCFLFKSLTDNALSNFVTAMGMFYFEAYKDVLKIDLLLNVLLWELKCALQKEPARPAK